MLASSSLSARTRIQGGPKTSSFARKRLLTSSHARKVAIEVKSDLEPDNISVLVVGGSGVAMDVFRQLTAAGTWVTVLQRHEDNRSEVRAFARASKRERIDFFLCFCSRWLPKGPLVLLLRIDTFHATFSSILVRFALTNKRDANRLNLWVDF